MALLQVLPSSAEVLVIVQLSSAGQGTQHQQALPSPSLQCAGVRSLWRHQAADPGGQAAAMQRLQGRRPSLRVLLLDRVCQQRLACSPNSMLRQRHGGMTCVTGSTASAALPCLPRHCVLSTCYAGLACASQLQPVQLSNRGHRLEEKGSQEGSMNCCAGVNKRNR